MESVRHWLFDYFWMVEIAFVFFALAGCNFLLKKAIALSKKRARCKETDWRAHLDFAALLPARVLLWILFSSFAIDLARSELELRGVFGLAIPFRNAGIVFCLAWFLLRWKAIVQNALFARHGKGDVSVDVSSVEALGKLFTIAVLFLASLIGIQMIGVNVAPLIAFSGIGAAAIGIAGKDVIANFFGGLMIYLTRPFLIDDFIEIPEKGISGVVEDIGWYFTSIRDTDKKPLYIPNSVFSTLVLVNASRITHRRIDEVIRIRYEDAAKVLPLVEAIRSFLEAHPSLDARQKAYVFCKTIGPYSLEIEVQAYTSSTSYDTFTKMRQEILLEISEKVKEMGAEIAYPVTAVHMLSKEGI